MVFLNVIQSRCELRRNLNTHLIDIANGGGGIVVGLKLGFECKGGGLYGKACFI
jgi:hypothetical protein